MGITAVRPPYHPISRKICVSRVKYFQLNFRLLMGNARTRRIYRIGFVMKDCIGSCSHYASHLICFHLDFIALLLRWYAFLKPFFKNFLIKQCFVFIILVLFYALGFPSHLTTKMKSHAFVLVFLIIYLPLYRKILGKKMTGTFGVPESGQGHLSNQIKNGECGCTAC